MIYEGVTQDAAVKMNKAVELLEASLFGIRSSTITSACVETIKVPYYGQMTPIKHLATTADVTGKVLINPFDSVMLAEIVKALTNAGFNAYVFSKTSVAVSANPMSGGQREKVKVQIRKLGEEAKISVRSVRKQTRQKIDPTVSKDDKLKTEAEIQKLTSQTEARIDQIIFFKVESLG